MKDLQALSPITAVTMTSRDIADLTGKEHRNVLRDARAVLIELHGEGGLLRFEQTYRDPQNGQLYPELALPKRETLILVSGYSVTMRAAIIDRWQELEARAALQAQFTPMEVVSRDVLAVRGFLLTIGLDPNAAAIGANQVAINLHGVNLLQLSGNTHLLAANQECQALTPTALGKLAGGLSAQKVNKALEEAGLQKRVGDEWVPLPAAEGLYRLFDTGKKHGSGVPVTQLKWFPAAVDRLKRAA